MHEKILEQTVAVHIAGIGLSTSLLGFADSCAGFRAGINRFVAHQEIQTMRAGDEEPTPLTVSPAANNLWCYQGIAKTVKMLEIAYKDFIANYQQPVPTDSLQILLATPDPEDRALDMDIPPNTSLEAGLHEYISALSEPLNSKLDSILEQAQLQCVFGDRVAFARILQKAINLINSGEARHCLLLVADSLLDDEMLDLQLANNLVKTGDNPLGYIPGEGAAVILLSSQPPTKPGKNSINAKIGVSIHRENIDFEDEQAELNQWQGNTLLKLTQSQTKDLYENQWFPQLISDINGEERRAIELGNFMVKLKLAYPNASFLNHIVPALSFGEVGCMTGALAFATVIASRQRDYANSNEFLITLSEAYGKRAAIKMKL